MEKILPFFHYLYQFIKFSQAEFEQLIQPYIELRSYPKKALISKTGEVENYFNFVLTGLLRKYSVRGSEEINVQIATEGHIIYAEESFYSRIPSQCFIETIEPTTIVSITYDHLEELYSQNAKMERLGRLMATSSVLQRSKWLMQMIILTPRQRFLRFFDRHPDLVQRVPQKYLASYLNIQPETFSRFKHLIKSKQLSGLQIHNQ